MNKVLLIEDDDYLSEMIPLYLQKESLQVLCADDGRIGKEYAEFNQPDLIILDVMLPGIDGFSLCEMLREKSTVPIMMISAKKDVEQRVNGLSVGADDYLCKPFSLQELSARVKSLLRRASYQADRSGTGIPDTAREGPGESEPDRHKRAGIHLDVASRLLYVDGQTVELTYSEFEMMNLFVHNPGKVFSRDDLLALIKGAHNQYLVAERAIDVHITNLRRKIESDPRHPAFIKTVWGSGYKFIPMSRSVEE